MSCCNFLSLKSSKSSTHDLRLSYHLWFPNSHTLISYVFTVFSHSWCLAYSQISTIWVSSKQVYIGWPQQPPTEKVPNISEKLHFWWSIPKKGTVIGHLGAGDDQTIRINNFFDEMRLSRSLRLLRLQRF